MASLLKGVAGRLLFAVFLFPLLATACLVGLVLYVTWILPGLSWLITGNPQSWEKAAYWMLDHVPYLSSFGGLDCWRNDPDYVKPPESVPPMTSLPPTARWPVLGRGRFRGEARETSRPTCGPSEIPDRDWNEWDN
jgi:hypothetical protein